MSDYCHEGILNVIAVIAIQCKHYYCGLRYNI